MNVELRKRAIQILNSLDLIIFDQLFKDDPKEAEHFLEEVWYWNNGPGQPDRDHFGK